VLCVCVCGGVWRGAGGREESGREEGVHVCVA
jgi:hypothetical protein